MTFLNQARIELRRLELENARQEYAELWDAWKVLEAKAQPTSATAGVFLAGVFAYASAAAKDLSAPERWLLIALAVLLVGSVVQALRAIWVVTVESPGLGMAAKDEVDKLISTTQPQNGLEDRYEGLLSETSRRLMSASEDVRTNLEKKAKLLVNSLRLLAGSAAATTVLIAYTLFGR